MNVGVSLGTAGDLYPYPSGGHEQLTNDRSRCVGMIIFFTARAWSSKMLFGDSVVGNQVVYHLASIIWIRLPGSKIDGEKVIDKT